MKQYKSRDKITQKMTRDGLIEVNETQQTAERISSREADSDFSQPDSAAAERVIEHLDAAHTRKANKKEVKKEQEATALRTSTSRLQFTEEERATPELETYIKKSEKAADRLDAAKAVMPKQKKPQERQRPACTLRNRKSRYPAAKPTATRYPAPRRKRGFLFTTKSTASRKTIPARRARTNRRNLPSAAQGTGQGNSNRATAAIS